jgi:hypothetical protein
MFQEDGERLIVDITHEGPNLGTSTLYYPSLTAAKATSTDNQGSTSAS